MRFVVLDTGDDFASTSEAIMRAKKQQPRFWPGLLVSFGYFRG